MSDAGVTFGFNRFDMTSAAGFASSVARGEALGYQHAFIPSSPLLVQDPYVLLASALAATRVIRVGPLLENPVIRHPAVIAGSISTLDQIAPGRTTLTLGVGDTAVRTLGLQPARVAELRSGLKTIRSLLTGEKTLLGGVKSRLRHARAVPVWVAAGGPKTLRMAGQWADGVVIRVGTHEDNIDAALNEVRAGAAAAGRSLDELHIAMVLHTVMSEAPEEVDMIGRAIAAGYYEYAPYLFRNIGLDWNGPDVEGLRANVWQDFHHTPDLIAAGRLVSFLPDRVVDDFCLHGDGPRISRQLQSLVSRHPEISLIVPHPMQPPTPADGQPQLRFMERFAHEVMADFGRA
ncbi:MAG: LLM class flavin-dependent oxidoreductase [Proteobacteria bacterium]|nr:LLM class flavin-dependent oxidoreductase [Pseudomonadota bacterium]